MKLLRLSLYLTVLSLCLFSCSSSDRDEDDTTEATIENAVAENLMNDVWKEIHSIILMDTVLNPQDTTPPQEACIDSIKGIPAVPAYPVSFNVYYGDVMCIDGRQRKGVVTASLTGKYVDSASVLTINFQDYWVDDYKLSGSMTITNTGLTNGFTRFEKEVINGKVWKDGFGVGVVNILYDATENVIWGVGATSDTIPSDDEFRISGTTSGRNSRGKFFTTVITDPLISTTSCNWETAGKYTLKLGTLADRYIDLGGGVCDNSVEIKINGSTQTFVYE